MKHVCIDRVLPGRSSAPQAVVGERAISPINKQWPVGATLTVGFIGGSQTQRDFVSNHLADWTSLANLKLAAVKALPADIRVSFDEFDGSWSYVGTDAKMIPSNVATMNFGWLDKAVVRHEVGHALGLAHEHQNPSGGIKWNRDAVIADLSGPPNYWSIEDIEHNVLNKYAADQIIGTEFDRESIMLYSFPPEWTLDGFSAPWNEEISKGDAGFVSSARMYPFSTTVLPKLPVAVALVGAIAQRGEADEYEMDVEVYGKYTIGTTGAADLTISVYSGTRLVAYDDNSGPGYQPLVNAVLAVGKYRVVVRHASALGTGGYKLLAWR